MTHCGCKGWRSLKMAPSHAKMARSPTDSSVCSPCLSVRSISKGNVMMPMITSLLWMRTATAWWAIVYRVTALTLWRGLDVTFSGVSMQFSQFQRSEKQTSWTKSAVRPLSRAKDGSCAGHALGTFPGTKVCAPPWRTTREKQLAWVDSWSSSGFFQYLPVAVARDRFTWRYTCFLVNNWRQNIR